MRASVTPAHVEGGLGRNSSAEEKDTVDQRSEELLRRLAINDEAAVGAALLMNVSETHESGLDAKTAALVRLASLVSLPSSPQSYEWGVATALDSGASDDEVVGVLAVVAPVVGMARINRAAAEIATAVGCELDPPERP
jgi:alkylhydroperoxidase/carboxymuconolactone decarboxylase family protein YurZ